MQLKKIIRFKKSLNEQNFSFNACSKILIKDNIYLFIIIIIKKLFKFYYHLINFYLFKWVK